MALVKKPVMTEENQAAHRRNGRKSRGAATAEGKERARAANLRHGYYSQERDEAQRALGEDPAELAALLEGAQAEWRPAGIFQARVAERLGRLLWRMERAERIQESLVAGQMREHAKRRQHVLLQTRYKVIDLRSILELLDDKAADPRFYTPREYFRMFTRAFGEGMDEHEKEIFQLMHRLRKPGSGGKENEEEEGEPGAGGPEGEMATPAPAGPSGAGSSASSGEGGLEGGAVAVEEADEDGYLSSLAEMDEGLAPIPWPEIAVAEGAERDELRELLRQRARYELEIVEATWGKELKELERPLSRRERDELQAAPHRHGELMRREEEACFRQFVRLGNWLMKFQSQGKGCGVGRLGWEKQGPGHRSQDSEAEGAGVAAARVGPGTSAAANRENAGASGDVYENAGMRQITPRTNSPKPAASTVGMRQKVGNTESGVRNPNSERKGRMLAGQAEA